MRGIFIVRHLLLKIIYCHLIQFEMICLRIVWFIVLALLGRRNLTGAEAYSREADACQRGCFNEVSAVHKLLLVKLLQFVKKSSL